MGNKLNSIFLLSLVLAVVGLVVVLNALSTPQKLFSQGPKAINPSANESQSESKDNLINKTTEIKNQAASETQLTSDVLNEETPTLTRIKILNLAAKRFSHPQLLVAIASAPINKQPDDLVYKTEASIRVIALRHLERDRKSLHYLSLYAREPFIQDLAKDVLTHDPSRSYFQDFETAVAQLPLDLEK